MKIACRSGNEYDLKVKFTKYQELQKAVRVANRNQSKHGRVLQRVQKGEEVPEAEIQAAETVVFELMDGLEDLVIPWLRDALNAQNPPINLDEIDEPEDVDDMVKRLLGVAGADGENPLAASPASIPTG